MANDLSLSTALANDARGLDALKRQAHATPDKALRTAATQFEALFMNMLLKNMRDASPKDGLLASSSNDTYTAMLDQQLSQKMAERGTGLADMLVRQLSRNVKGPATGAVSGPIGRTEAQTDSIRSPAATRAAAGNLMFSKPAIGVDPRTTAPVSATSPIAAADSASSTPATTATTRKRDFIDRMAAHAKAAEGETGVPAQFIMGQAALESGWGRREIKDANGQPAHNLFGIKATKGWSGPTVDVRTTEFVDGVAKKVVAKFRAYASYAEGFADYAKLLTGNPRFAAALKNVDGADPASASRFANGLQRAGYATDPLYAAKLSRVIRDASRTEAQPFNPASA